MLQGGVVTAPAAAPAPTRSDRILACAASLSKRVAERLDQAHRGYRVVREEGKPDRLELDAEATDAEHTSWENLYPEAPAGQRSRSPHDSQTLGDGRVIVRILIPETLEVVSGIGPDMDAAVAMLERRTERYLEDVAAEGGPK